MHYRNETVVFRAKFNESVPKWDTLIWKMNNETLIGRRFAIFLPNMVLSF